MTTLRTVSTALADVLRPLGFTRRNDREYVVPIQPGVTGHLYLNTFHEGLSGGVLGLFPRLVVEDDAFAKALSAMSGKREHGQTDAQGLGYLVPGMTSTS
jgi:hypothetical protein